MKFIKVNVDLVLYMGVIKKKKQTHAHTRGLFDQTNLYGYFHFFFSTSVV